jgi:hypothetical protein
MVITHPPKSTDAYANFESSENQSRNVFPAVKIEIRCESYATRRGESLPIVEKRLAPNLDYNV